MANHYRGTRIGPQAIVDAYETLGLTVSTEVIYEQLNREITVALPLVAYYLHHHIDADPDKLRLAADHDPLAGTIDFVAELGLSDDYACGYDIGFSQSDLEHNTVFTGGVMDVGNGAREGYMDGKNAREACQRVGILIDWRKVAQADE